LIATYNRSNLLNKAIKSVTAQTFEDWELIIADDGSTDDTEKISRKWTEKDKRIKYIKAPHFGRIARISNFGLRNAQGEYIAILDDDDCWADDDKLKKQVKFLDDNRDYVGCGGGLILVDEKKCELGRFFKPREDEEMRTNALIANPMANSTTLFRAMAARDVGFYDETLPEFADWDFWLKMGLVGKLYNFEEYFTYYLMWEKGSSFSKQKGTAISALKIVPRYRGKYPRYHRAISVVYLYNVYARIPESIKKVFNPLLSKFKKLIFSSRSAHPFE